MLIRTTVLRTRFKNCCLKGLFLNETMTLHSFILAIYIVPLQVDYYSGATVGKGLAKGPNVAARAGVEPTTLRLKVIDSTNAPPRTIFLEHENSLTSRNS